ncbi:hypothetical protein LLE49_20165 [Alicyclobacillus tolerans]|uniref:hypothetical protein n=1 Tax=Alicyclobacillus tolerans TaxID=90970 RepID=UPI001F4449E4|nr:hypothetical protein [Alicyclobacillus tolerans]MCF8567040.1 hypothetical protein [Alicyclobacillus tolerans]
MTRIILATGMDDLDDALKIQLPSDFQVESVSYLQALTVVDLHAGDIVMVSDRIPMSGAGDHAFMDVMDDLRKRDVRVIYIGEARPQDDKWIPAFISRGIYDLLLSDVIHLEDIVARVFEPATYADVAHWMAGKDPIVRSGSYSLHRPTLTWRKEKDEITKVESTSQESKTTQERPFRLGFGKTHWEGTKPQTKVVTVTGLPGAGVSFVALHLALSYSKVGRVTLIELSQRPVYTKWLNGPVGDRGAQQLGAKKIPERRWMPYDSLRILPAHSDERGPSLRVVRPMLQELDTDVVILDVSLDDVRNLVEPVDVLVIPPDVVKADHVRDIQTRLVVVNSVPRVLPVELEEYGRAWPGATVASCPYVAEQALAVVTGKAVDGPDQVSDTWRVVLGT